LTYDHANTYTNIRQHTHTEMFEPFFLGPNTHIPEHMRNWYMSHHHTYYVTSSYILCHIIPNTHIPEHMRNWYSRMCVCAHTHTRTDTDTRARARTHTPTHHYAINGNESVADLNDVIELVFCAAVRPRASG